MAVTTVKTIIPPIYQNIPPSADVPQPITLTMMEADSRRGARHVLSAVVVALALIEAGVFVGTTFGIAVAVGLLGDLTRELTAILIFGSMWLGHASALAAHVVSLLRLYSFLFVPTPLMARAPRSVRAHARREKFPLAVTWARLSICALFVTLALLTTEVLLFIQVPLRFSLSPLIMLLIIDIALGVLCRGRSLLRFAAASIAIFQIRIILLKVQFGECGAKTLDVLRLRHCTTRSPREHDSEQHSLLRNSILFV